MATRLNGRGSARQKPMGGGFETLSWYFMRVSGVILLLIAVGHLILMHIFIQVENIDYNLVASRWTGAWGPFWRVYDLALLVFALVHGFNGLRWVLDDYIHRPGLRTAVKSIVYVVGVVVILMGAYVLFSFQA